MDFRPIIFLVAALPLLLTALFLLARAWQGQRQAFAARKWPRTTGRIITATVEESMIRQRVRTSVSRYRWVKRYTPRILYEYSAQGRIFRGARIYFGEILYSSDPNDASRLLTRYPVGNVTVYYNPVNPAEAILEPRVGPGTIILWSVASLLLITIGFIARIIFT